VEKKFKKTGTIKEDAIEMVAALLGIGAKKEGIVVYQYCAPTDGCLYPGHIAVTIEPNGKTFFGIPQKAIIWN
jgi:hypothetical protein